MFLAFLRDRLVSGNPALVAARAYASRRRAAEQKGRNVHEASAPTGMMSGGLHQARAPGLATEDAGGLRAQPRAAYVVFPHEELVNV